MKCKYCNAELDSDALFCTNCGKDLSKFRKCIKCGELLDANALFCTECGTEQPQYDESDYSSKRWLWLAIKILAFLCLAGGLALGYFFYQKATTDKANKKIDATEVVEETNGAQGGNQSIEKAYSSSEQSTTIGYDKPSVRETNGRHYLQGSVDKYPITMEIDIDGSSVSGSYYYNKNGSNARLYLSGTCNNGVLDLNEVDANGTPTGHFQGSYSDGHFNGVFTTNQGKQMYFQVFE